MKLTVPGHSPPETELVHKTSVSFQDVSSPEETLLLAYMTLVVISNLNDSISL